MSGVDIILKQLAMQVKAARKRMGITQIEAAYRLRVDYRHYQSIEGGKVNLRFNMLLRIIRFYGLEKDFSFEIQPEIFLADDGAEDSHVSLQTV